MQHWASWHSARTHPLSLPVAECPQLGAGKALALIWASLPSPALLQGGLHQGAGCVGQGTRETVWCWLCQAMPG